MERTMSNPKFLSKMLNAPEEICEFLLKLFEIYEIRGIIYQANAIKYEVRFKEKGHNRPHIHVAYGEFEMSISIDYKIEILAGKLPKKKQKDALMFVKKNINRIRNEWNKVHIDMKLPLTSSALLAETIKN